MKIRELVSCVTLFFILSCFTSPSKTPKAQYPAAALSSYNKGLEAQNNGDYEKAVQYYEQAISEKEDFPDAFNNMGFSYRMIAKSNLDKAGVAYQRALKLDPKHEYALEYQGEYMIMRGKLTQAYQNYQTLKNLNPKLAQELKQNLDSALQEAQSVLKSYQP